MRRASSLGFWIGVLWPSFLAAGLASGLVFALIDPLDVAILGVHTVGRSGFYTVTFFLLWAMGACSSALTLWLQPTQAPDEED
ncbi:hypothetical protein [Bordetella hinzii]|uniref:Uncharacterized protein n=1 Tax=Bordetella hinzii TaxID=103855 RepID=A0AAN1RT08_9BORD|nr:hypothetical protein [Bordetella hinzii]AKQ54755.1 hypothetical protein ACR54_01421 [Bordetella hinzii]AKQ59268.1 hypothetical protein ACR55_01382 [Bordetella hinzii]AZW15486.1 hypothetical protein CS347_01105 [Bordetella hinzii]KCB50751.1 hypothetical protein L537_2820 [Bordetella hinzii 1277]KXA72344.1 hypothetical protein AXA74_13730 [Bordetella hinzii LMG 13501]